MERFIDRLRGGQLRPYAPDVLADPVEHENAVREQISEQFILRNHRAPTMAELGQLTRFALEHTPVRGVEKFDRSLLSGIPVIAADDVARYCEALPAGTDVSDVVATMAPPFILAERGIRQCRMGAWRVHLYPQNLVRSHGSGSCPAPAATRK